MNTYFVRHNTGIDIDDETRKRLWDERRIAIHYPRDGQGKLSQNDNSSTNPDNYTGSAKSRMRTLTALAKEGGYVCAQHHPREEWMLGIVQPESEVELFKGRWGGPWAPKERRTAILKSVRLSRIRFVNPLDYAVLAVGRPRQGTIMRWHLAGKTVESLVEGRRTMPQLSDLSPRQQEILCSELLRLPEAEKLGLPRLAHLLLPTGHTMRDIDILGVATDGKKLIAQVTFCPLDSATRKVDRLQPYRDKQRAHLVLFCDCPDRTEQRGVTIFPLKRAFDVFVGYSPWRNMAATFGLRPDSTRKPAFGEQDHSSPAPVWRLRVQAPAQVPP